MHTPEKKRQNVVQIYWLRLSKWNFLQERVNDTGFFLFDVEQESSFDTEIAVCFIRSELTGDPASQLTALWRSKEFRMNKHL